MKDLQIKTNVPFPFHPFSKERRAPKKKPTKTSVTPVTSAGKTVMGFKIETGKLDNDHKPFTGTRPKSWEPLFSALAVGESFEAGKKISKKLHYAVTRYNGKMSPKQFVFQALPGGKARIGRVK